MKGKLMLAVSAMLLTALVGLVFAQQKSEQKPEQTPEQKQEQKAADSDKKDIKIRTGEVVSTDAAKNQIVFKDDAGVEVRLLVGSFTKITRDGKSITLADVKTGDKISSECAESSDGCKAKSIQVMPPAPSQ